MNPCGLTKKQEEQSLRKDDWCPKTKDHKHVPDWKSMSITEDGETYVDINCKKCGRSGCVGTTQTLKDNICW